MNTRKMILLALLTVMAGVLHFVEVGIPVPLPIPGFKLGLANIITLYAVVYLGLREALIIVMMRVLLGSLLTGTLLSSGFFMSLVGSLLACIVMYAVNRYLRMFSVLGVSVCGAVAHNIGQLAVAAVLIDSTAVWYYLPYLILFAVFTGSFTGLVVLHLPGNLRVEN